MNDKHWTDKSPEDLQYAVMTDTVDQLWNAFEDSHKDPRVLDSFLNEPNTMSVEDLTRAVFELNMKLSIVIYKKDDPMSGPVFSTILLQCWEALGKPRSQPDMDNALSKGIVPNRKPPSIMDTEEKLCRHCEHCVMCDRCPSYERCNRDKVGLAYCTKVGWCVGVDNTCVVEVNGEVQWKGLVKE